MEQTRTQFPLRQGKGVKTSLETLGSGNHFLEVQVVDKIFDGDAARSFGLSEGQVAVMIHCGSRGLGHQVCDDHIRLMNSTMKKYGISVPDRQLLLCTHKIRRREKLSGSDVVCCQFCFGQQGSDRKYGKGCFHDAFSLHMSFAFSMMSAITWPISKSFPYGEGRKSFCVHRKRSYPCFYRRGTLIYQVPFRKQASRLSFQEVWERQVTSYSVPV